MRAGPHRATGRARASRHGLAGCVLLAVVAGLLLGACAHPSGPTPTATPSALERGARLVATGAYTAAEAALQEALAASAAEPEPALALADLYLAWDKPNLGLQILDEAVARGAPSAAIQDRELRLLVAKGAWAEVVALAERRLEHEPHDVTALQALLRAQLAQTACDAAAERAERLRAIDPAALDALTAQALLAKEDISDLSLGLRLIRNDRWGLAACVLQRAVRAAPEDAEAHVWLGEALSRLGQAEAAERHFRRALDLAPDSALAWLLLGKHDLSTEDHDSARVALLNAQRLDPLNPAPCLAIAELKAKMGAYDEVDTWLDAALVRGYDDPEVWKAVARFRLSRNLGIDRALKAAQGAVELAPEDAEALGLVAWAQLFQQEPLLALQTLEEALALDPGMAELHYRQAQALQATGALSEAQAAFTTAADLGYPVD